MGDMMPQYPHVALPIPTPSAAAVATSPQFMAARDGQHGWPAPRHGVVDAPQGT